MTLTNKLTGLPISKEAEAVLEALIKAYVGESMLNKNGEKEMSASDVSFFRVKTDYQAFVKEHGESLSVKRGRAQHTTLVINAFGGPGAGKSTASLGIAEELKKLGYAAEYVPEYSKELVWDENWELLNGSAAHQLVILKEQMKRMDRLEGKVDFIVTDAPILLNQIYNKELTSAYETMLQDLYSQYENFNFVVQRNPNEFENAGRIHDLEESRQKDGEIKDMLDKYGLYYGTYHHASVNKVIPNAVKTHGRISAMRHSSSEKNKDRDSVLAKLNQNKEKVESRENVKNKEKRKDRYEQRSYAK